MSEARKPTTMRVLWKSGRLVDRDVEVGGSAPDPTYGVSPITIGSVKVMWNSESRSI